MIEYDNILNLFTNEFISVEKGERYISADIARLGRDNTIIGLWEGFTCFRIVKIGKNKVTEAAELIKHYAKKYKVPMQNIIVDEDGVGGGVVDILGCKGFVNNSRPLNDENYANLKSQCYFKLAAKINSNEMYVQSPDTSIIEELTEELEQVKQKDMDKDRPKSIIPKEKVKEIIGRSPDLSDMLAMRMWFDLSPTWETYVF